MLSFLKRFGLGMLYVLCSPLILAFLCLWAASNFLIFLIELCRAIKSFFKGRAFFVEFDEDIEAKKILSIEAINGGPNSSIVTPNMTMAIANMVSSQSAANIQPSFNNQQPMLSKPSINDEAIKDGVNNE